MDGMLTDVRMALRFLRRHPGFSCTAVGVLALGISLSATLLAIVRGTLLEPWPYHGSDRIVVVRGSYPVQGRADFSLWSAPEIEDLRRLPDIFDHVIAGDARNINLTFNGRAERVRAAVVTPNVFAMLGVGAFIGRTLQEMDAAPASAPVAVVSYRFWRNRLGADPSAVGRLLRSDDRLYTIVGVMPERFVFWDRDVWMPLWLNPLDARADRRYYVQAQLHPGIGLPAAHSRLRGLAAALAANHPEQPEYAGLGIGLTLLVEDVLRDLRPTLYLLLGAVALVLVVATANLANATLAQGMAREGDLAIRRAIGGSAAQIARQLCIESAIVGMAGGVAGAAAGSFLLPQIVAFIPYGYVAAEARVEMDWRMVAIATLCSVGCGLIIGVVPAVRATMVDPMTLLKHGDARTGSRRAHRFRDAFVVAQLTLAVVVLGIAAAAAASLREAIARDPGYRAAGVWTARLALPPAEAAPGRAAETYDRIVRRLRESRAVDDVALASNFPAGPLPTTLVSAESSGAAAQRAVLDAGTMAVSPGFFPLLHVAASDGRVFDDADTADRPPVALVSHGLARRLWPAGGAVGSRLIVGVGAEAVVTTVAGIVGDVRTNAADARLQPIVLRPLAQQPPAAVVIGVRAPANRDALDLVTDAVRAVDRDIPIYRPEMLEQTQIGVLGPQLLAAALLALFGFAVLALSSVGIYAVVSQSVQERAQEIRIRMTFGAEPRRLFAAEMMRAGRLVSVSAIGGVAVACAALRVLSGAFSGFGGSPIAPLAASTGVLAALAAAATAVPAWRACRRSATGRT
jgi:putative ABC transport system permease protein